MQILVATEGRETQDLYNQFLGVVPLRLLVFLYV